MHRIVHCAAVLFAASALSVAALAQPVAPAVSAAASAPPAKGPRLLTPADQRANAEAAAAPDLRPDRPVVPQIRIPIGRTPPAPASAASQAPQKQKAPRIAP